MLHPFLIISSLKSSLEWAPLLSFLFSAEATVTIDCLIKLSNSKVSTKSVLKIKDLSDTTYIF